MKVTAFFEDDYITPILKALVAHSATPLRAVEMEFAIDSSGFGSIRYERWFDAEYGDTRLTMQIGQSVKVHIARGVRTNVVAAVRILDQHAGDSPLFAPLVHETARSFTISEVGADKAYSGLENFEAVAACGGQAYMAFKEGTTGFVGGLFKKAFHLVQFNQE